jgi:hypothetical protein
MGRLCPTLKCKRIDKVNWTEADKIHTSSVVQLCCDADTGPVLCRKRKVGFAHGDRVNWMTGRYKGNVAVFVCG